MSQSVAPWAKPRVRWPGPRLRQNWRNWSHSLPAARDEKWPGEMENYMEQSGSIQPIPTTPAVQTGIHQIVPTKRRIHFMGISGHGCSAVAQLAQALGEEVSGCE